MFFPSPSRACAQSGVSKNFFDGRGPTLTRLLSLPQCPRPAQPSHLVSSFPRRICATQARWLSTPRLPDPARRKPAAALTSRWQTACAPPRRGQCRRLGHSAPSVQVAVKHGAGIPQLTPRGRPRSTPPCRFCCSTPQCYAAQRNTNPLHPCQCEGAFLAFTRAEAQSATHFVYAPPGLG